MTRRFNTKGMMIVPCQTRKEIKDCNRVLVVKSCFCSQGHNLISSRALFNGHPGIMVKIKNDEKAAFAVLSPIYGDKTRISMGADLEEGDAYHFYCPECDSQLPTHSICSCGGSYVALFNDPSADFSDCIGICNRVGCTHSVILNGNELFTHACMDNFIRFS